MSVRLLNVREVAERLRLSPWTVYDLVRRGRLPVVRLTARLLFDEAAVEEALRRAERPARGSAATGNAAAR